MGMVCSLLRRGLVETMTDCQYVRNDGLEGSFDRQIDFIVHSEYELGWRRVGGFLVPGW
jgi:hypothetical protein